MNAGTYLAKSIKWMIWSIIEVVEKFNLSLFIVGFAIAVFTADTPLFAAEDDEKKEKSLTEKERKKLIEESEQGASNALLEQSNSNPEQSFEQFLEIQEIQTRYDNCKAYEAENYNKNKPVDMGQCIWTGHIDGKTDDPPQVTSNAGEVSQTTQDLIFNKLEIEDKETKEKKMADLTQIGTLKQIEDEGIKELRKHYAKKLDESLQTKLPGKEGEEEKNKIANLTMDHSNFHKIYKSKIAHNLITAISQYCLDAERVSVSSASGDQKVYVYLIKKGETFKDKVRKLRENAAGGTNDPNSAKNILETPRLKTIMGLSKDTLAGQGGLGNLAAEDGQAQQYEKEEDIPFFVRWKQCLASIPKVCYAKRKDFKTPEDQNQGGGQGQGGEGQQKQNGQIAGVDEKARHKACEVTGFIKSARAALINVNGIVKKLDEQKDKSEEIAERMRLEELEPEELNIHKLTALSSGDLDESGYTAKINEKIQLAEQCAQTAGGTAQCDELVADKEQAQETKKQIDEAALRAIAIEKKLEKDFQEGGDSKVRDFLKKEGHDDTEIQAIIGGNLEQAKLEIRSRHKSERLALINSLHDRLSETADAADYIGPTAVGPEGKKELFQKVRAELLERSEGYKQLALYQSAISGYLEFTSSGGGLSSGSGGRNTVALSNELENSAYRSGGAGGGGRAPGGNLGATVPGGGAVITDPAYASAAQQIQQNFSAIETANRKNISSDDSKASDGYDLPVETINNQILRYNNSPVSGE